MGKIFSLIGPLNNTRINEISVEISNVNPIILIRESSELYFPKDKIDPQMQKIITWLSIPNWEVWNKFCKNPAVTAPTADDIKNPITGDLIPQLESSMVEIKYLEGKNLTIKPVNCWARIDECMPMAQVDSRFPDIPTTPRAPHP